MYQKLQRNFDIIQYLVENTTPEQLTWCKDVTGWSLGEIICHLRNMELEHTHLSTLVLPGQNHPSLPPNRANNPLPKNDNHTPNYKLAFAQYTASRRETVTLLQNIPPAQQQETVTHPFFGHLTWTELVEKIDAHDRSQIHRIEEVVHSMPINPLLARALYEISDYHQRYQPHLRQAHSLLDIGVGPGLALQHIKHQNSYLALEGVDVRDLRVPEVDIPLQVYDGDTLPFTENRFDISLLFYVLHHCHSPHRVLDEAIRVTGQKLIIIEEFTLPGADETSLDLTERQSHRALNIPPDLPYQLFDKPQFEAMLQERNLIELEQHLLPSKTTRPIQKYLYIVEVSQATPTD